MTKEILTIDDLNDGAVNDFFQEEFAKVLKNIADDNTDWKINREVTIKVKVKPLDESREAATLTVEAVSKLAPIKTECVNCLSCV